MSKASQLVLEELSEATKVSSDSGVMFSELAKAKGSLENAARYSLKFPNVYKGKIKSVLTDLDLILTQIKREKKV